MGPRRARPARRTLRHGLAIVLLSSCGAEEPVLDYQSSASLQVCDGTIAYMQGFVPFVAGELGLAVEETITYSWLSEAEYPASTCPEGSAGCQFGSHAYARRPAIPHEVVHAVTEVNGMNGLRFLTEGIATAYDPFGGSAPGPRYMHYPAEGQPGFDPIGELLGQPDSYLVAGTFVTFLLLRHGPEKFVSLTRTLASNSTLEEVRARFLESYGVALDDEAEVYRINGACADIVFDVPAYDCAMPERPWEGSTWSWSTSLDCADDGVVGGVDPERPSNHFRSVAITIPATGRYTLKLEADEQTQVTLGRCFGCPWSPKDNVVATGATRELELAAGAYFMRLTTPPGSAPAAHVTLVAVE